MICVTELKPGIEGLTFDCLKSKNTLPEQIEL